jgi:hypothetical protein
MGEGLRCGLPQRHRIGSDPVFGVERGLMPSQMFLSGKATVLLSFTGRCRSLLWWCGTPMQVPVLVLALVPRCSRSPTEIVRYWMETTKLSTEGYKLRATLRLDTLLPPAMLQTFQLAEVNSEQRLCRTREELVALRLCSPGFPAKRRLVAVLEGIFTSGQRTRVTGTAQVRRTTTTNGLGVEGGVSCCSAIYLLANRNDQTSSISLAQTTKSGGQDP